MGIDDTRHHREAFGIQQDVGIGRQRSGEVRHTAHDIHDPAIRDLEPAQRGGLGAAAVDQRAVDDIVGHQRYSTPAAR